MHRPRIHKGIQMLLLIVALCALPAYALSRPIVHALGV
jgi:hypothetical protein